LDPWRSRAQLEKYYSFWQGRYGGDPKITGQSISLSGRPFKIVGVTSPSFSGFDVGRDVDGA